MPGSGSAKGSTSLGGRAVVQDLARVVLAEETTQSVLQRVVDAVKEAGPPGAEASITVLRGGSPSTTASTGELALHLDQVQYGRGEGPCLEAAVAGQLVEIADGRSEGEGRWPGVVAEFLQAGVVSVLAVPVASPRLGAAVNVYAPVPHAFTGAHRQAVVEVAAVAAVVLTNLDALQDARDLAENLHKAMETRAVIEQAKGVLIERYKVTADQAFRLLADGSMNTNSKLRDLAENLVRTGELSP